MLDSLRRSYAQLLTSGAQLLLLFVGFQLQARAAWLACLGLMAFISLLAWYSALKRLRIISGTPTSNVASAAQGYVELQGRGRSSGAAPLISKLRGLPCLWYRYRVEERTGRSEWRVIDSGEVSEPFLLDDGSGTCVVDPSGAEIDTKHKDSWGSDPYRYIEWTLINNDYIYALGEFRTEGGSTAEQTLNDEVKQVLQEWKADMPRLRAQFDLNNDGVFDEQEWLLARKAAKREAEQRLKVLRAAPDTHYMVQPADGRLFLISNFDQDALASRYKFWSWAHVIIMLGALIGFGRVLAWH
ncbi:MAG TPA: hypothetical protein VFR06_08510 [Gallionellaceae bacterium]|nr:hypothetical protein [Gallionellaceae bacterium]